MSVGIEQQPRIQSYGSVDEQCVAVDRKLDGFRNSTYVRYGTVHHAELEDAVAELNGAHPDNTLIFSHGMSTIHAAVGVGLDQSTRERPVIAVSNHIYPGTLKWIEKQVRRRKAILKRFDAFDIRDVTDLIDEHKPDVLFAETVGNAPEAPVLDHEGLLIHARATESETFLILDRTVPTSTASDVFERTLPEDNACVLESLTKAGANNDDGLGAAYSKNPGVINKLRTERGEEGFASGTGSAIALLNELPTKHEFDEINFTILTKTGEVALALFEIEKLSSENFKVHHPSVPTHLNYGQAHVPRGGNVMPVIFLEPLDNNRSASFARRIGDHPGVSQHIGRRDSFAFRDTAFYTSNHVPYVRLAPGRDIDVKVLTGALYDALKD